MAVFWCNGFLEGHGAFFFFLDKPVDDAVVDPFNTTTQPHRRARSN